MNFVIKVAYLDGTDKPWDEPYNKPDVKTLEEAKAWAEKTIAWFNSTLRPNEKARKVIDVTLAEGNKKLSTDHVWKKTNLFTVIDRLGVYDRMQCMFCGITAKRFGLDHIKIDSAFRAKKFQTCSGKRVEL